MPDKCIGCLRVDRYNKFCIAYMMPCGTISKVCKKEEYEDDERAENSKNS